MIDLGTAIRDSIALERAATFRELEYVIRNIEARHAVEGIDADDLRVWEAERNKHLQRVARAVLA